MRPWEMLTKTYYSVILVTLAAVSAVSPVVAQPDPGLANAVYIDSVETSPGSEVSLHVMIRNDRPLSTWVLPLVYDPGALRLREVSFDGAVGQQIAGTMIAPSPIDSINGQFVVTQFIVTEAPIAPGEGLLATLRFEVAQSVASGRLLIIDTALYAPASRLMLIEADSSHVIVPHFTLGRIFVTGENHAPAFVSMPAVTVFEGDSLNMIVSAVDPDGDSLRLGLTDKPAGMRFVDLGDGRARLSWAPSFTGPSSADGSPYLVKLWANDGDRAAVTEIDLTVVNVNRRPQISGIASYQAESGDLINFQVTAGEPDFEAIEWQVTGLPAAATFDKANPGSFSWHTSFADVGLQTVEFVAADPQGLADTFATTIELKAATVYAVELDTLSAYPGEKINFNITIDNKAPVSSFELILEYDPTALFIGTVTKATTRIESFEQFVLETNVDGVAGRLRLTAARGSAAPLAIGKGPVAVLSFTLAGNLNYSGLSIPIRFRLGSLSDPDANSLTDSLGVTIPLAEITFVDGYVGFLSYGEIRIGDINLNGLAYDIADAIYFTNYFINPTRYPMNPLQLANSDVNGDNLPGTIADLVRLINVVASGSLKIGVDEDLSAARAAVWQADEEDASAFGTEADEEVGAVLFVIAVDGPISPDQIVAGSHGLTIDHALEGAELRVLVYSMEGAALAVGEQELFRIEGAGGLRLEHAEAATAGGREIEISYKDGRGVVPEGFVLEQNYPNPFNPSTAIAFSLPGAGRVELTVFNLLGERVRVLFDDYLPAGTHSVTWDSRTESGSPAASGIYFYRLSMGSLSQTRKMLLVK